MKHPIPFVARRAVLWALALLALLLPMLAPAQQVTYFHTDALGSTVMESNEAGAVTYSRDFRPYGEHVIGATKEGPGFTGHVTDTVTGLTYMQQRYYDPTIGRFLSVDPVTALDNGDMRHFNRYAYAFNNPYAFTDPDGRQSKAGGKQLGRVIRAAWESGGDAKKFNANMEAYQAEDRMVANAIVEATSVAIVKDAVEVVAKVANDKDATGQGTGAIAGEVAGKITEKVLDGKIGADAASGAGAAVGKAVGDSVEAIVDRSRGESPGAASKPKPDPAPVRNLELRNKIGDK